MSLEMFGTTFVWLMYKPRGTKIEHIRLTLLCRPPNKPFFINITLKVSCSVWEEQNIWPRLFPRLFSVPNFSRQILSRFPVPDQLYDFLHNQFFSRTVPILVKESKSPGNGTRPKPTQKFWKIQKVILLVTVKWEILETVKSWDQDQIFPRSFSVPNFYWIHVHGDPRLGSNLWVQMSVYTLQLRDLFETYLTWHWLIKIPTQY